MNLGVLTGSMRSWLRPFDTEQEIRRFQDRQLRRLIHHAWANVPHYRR